MLVILPSIVKALTLIPAVKNGVHGLNKLAHMCSGLKPGHAEAALNMGFYLGAQTQHQPTTGKSIQVVSKQGHGHGIARESHGDGGHQLHSLTVLSRQRQWQKGVIIQLRDAYAIVTH